MLMGILTLKVFTAYCILKLSSFYPYIICLLSQWILKDVKNKNNL